MKKLKLNSVKCLSCNTTLISKHQHDFQMCSCDNKVFVDGGNVYWRVGYNNRDLVEDLSVWEEV